MKRKIAVILSAAMMTSLIPGAAFAADSGEILVTNTAELIAAFAEVKAGDEIVLREGIYQADPNSGAWRPFQATADGTESAHIILRSEDPGNPATICANSSDSKCVLTITGSYWEIRDLKISTGCKGIFLAKSDHSVISGCEVFDIGEEAIHIIDDSSYNLVENCKVHDTGKKTPKYGEGVYIGSAKNSTDYGFECHYNTVRNCEFGPNIAADHVDIKEFTYGNLVEYCTFDGTGMQGENGGDSFVEIKGNNAVIRYNTGYRNGCEKQRSAFDMNVQLDGWGQGTKIYDNTLYLDTSDCYVVKAWNCRAEVFRNRVEPADCVVDGNYILQVETVQLTGDANGDANLNDEDARCLRQYLLGETVPYISGENADVNGDGVLNAADLSLVKRVQMYEAPPQIPMFTVGFVKEAAGKWRMTDGLSERTLTFTLLAEPGSDLNMGWGYWDQNAINESTGNAGKWISFSLGHFTADENGVAEITVEVPKDGRRVALEVWDYANAAGDLDVDGVTLKTVAASMPLTVPT